MIVLLDGSSFVLFTSVNLENFPVAAKPPFTVLETVRITRATWAASLYAVMSTAEPRSSVGIVDANDVSYCDSSRSLKSVDAKFFTNAVVFVAFSYVYIPGHCTESHGCLQQDSHLLLLNTYCRRIKAA